MKETVPRAPRSVRLEKLPYSTSPLSIFEKLEEDSEWIFLLESVEGPERLAKFSFIGFNPRLVISVKDRNAKTYDRTSGREETQDTNDPLDICLLYTSDAADE